MKVEYTETFIPPPCATCTTRSLVPSSKGVDEDINYNDSSSENICPATVDASTLTRRPSMPCGSGAPQP